MGEKEPKAGEPRGEGLRRETLKEAHSEAQNPRGGPLKPMVPLTILPVRPSPNGPRALGLRSTPHTRRSQQTAQSWRLPARGAGREGGRRTARGGGALKGTWRRLLWGEVVMGAERGSTALNCGHQARSQPGTDLGPVEGIFWVSVQLSFEWRVELMMPRVGRRAE